MAYLDDNGLLYFWQKIKTYVTGQVPSKTSDLTNDSGYITINDVPPGSAASSTTPKMDGTAATGSENAFARGDHIHPTDTSRAPLASPALTGVPTAPTAAFGEDTTQIATTAFVQDAVDDIVTGIQGRYALLTDVPAATTTTPKMDGTAAVGTDTTWAKGDHIHPTDTSRAPLASPAFTGTPTAPTATAGTNTTQIATTAFVKTAVDNKTVPSPSSTAPEMDGTAAAGSSANYARGDHVHPTDTSRAAASHNHAASDINSGTLSVARGGTGQGSVADARASWGFGFGICTTAAATAAKTSSITGFALIKGAMVMVRFSNANTAATPTLNVNSTGAKEIRKNNSTFAGIKAQEYLLVYDGTYWEVVEGIDTTYSNASSSVAGLMSSSDYSKLAAFGAASTYALKTDISGAYIYKGSVATEGDLPSSGQTAGDVYNIVAASSYGAAGANVAWTGTAWDALGETFTITAITNAEIDTIVAS